MEGNRDKSKTSLCISFKKTFHFILELINNVVMVSGGLRRESAIPYTSIHSSLVLQGDQTSQSWWKSVLNIHWKDWCWSSNTLATWCKELTPWKRPWCWERLKAGGEGDDRGWDGWMGTLNGWTWVWVSSGSWLWTGRPSVLQSMRSRRVYTTEWLNWTEQSAFLRNPFP